MSIRLRLTLWYLALLCAGLVAFAAVILWETDRSAQATLDQTLRQRAQDVAADLRISATSVVLRPDAPDESGPQPGDATVWIRVLDANGAVVLRQGPPLVGLPVQTLTDQQTGIHRADVGDRHIRLAVLPVVLAGRRIATVQVITETSQLEAARQELIKAMLLGGLLIIVIATLGGLFLAYQALRPVDRITRLAAQIGGSDLHRRVSNEVGDPRTRKRRKPDELGRLILTFDAMLGRLEEATERRRQLTADAAHELCTPLATIASGAEIALRHSRSGDEYRQSLQHIVGESRHLGRIVEDLLFLARADAGKLPMQHDLVEIDEVCRQAAEALTPLAAERSIHIQLELPSHAVLVMGDELRLVQVVRNLVDNAVRYTPNGGIVALTLEQHTKGNDATGQVIVRVTDSGPGIAIGERERIFERFHRLPDTLAAGAQRRRHMGSSGLGLAISKAIVEAHNGTIGVDSGKGSRPSGQLGGAQFVLTLPQVQMTDPD